MEYVTLNNKLECPVVGIGTFMLSPADAESIGISNFEGKYIEELETKWEIAPQFIQVEAHPYFTQKELRKTLDKYDIKLMSWYPLGHGDKSLISEPIFLLFSIFPPFPIRLQGPKQDA